MLALMADVIISHADRLGHRRGYRLMELTKSAAGMMMPSCSYCCCLAFLFFLTLMGDASGTELAPGNSTCACACAYARGEAES